MATSQRKRVISDVAADNTSESLSFAGLLSFQDLHSKSPVPHNSFNRAKNSNRDSEFSFGTTEFSANSLNKMSCTNTSIVNGNHQIQLQAFLRQSSNEQKPGSKTVTRRNNQPSSDKGEDKVKVYDGTKHRARNQENKERSASSPSLGKKIFQSVVSPCRECHAHKPATKENSMPRETVRAY